jgi:hypothetical protein
MSKKKSQGVLTISPRLAPDLWGDGGGVREGLDKGMSGISTLMAGRVEGVDLEASSAQSWRSLSVAADSWAFSVSISETRALSEGVSECEMPVLAWESARSLAFSCSRCATRLESKVSPSIDYQV